MEETVTVIIIVTANDPRPPGGCALRMRADAARAMRDLRSFARHHGLPPAAQRAIWRHNADLIRAGHAPLAGYHPGTGDAA